ncbi:MAG: helix-turn-helix domain-containing protein [Acidimicrobiales bacterium]
MEITYRYREHGGEMATRGLDELTPFGAMVKALRSRRGISQTDLAREANMSRGYVALLETGKRGQRPARDSVLALAQALRTTRSETERLLRSAGYTTAEVGGSPERPSFESFVLSDPLLKREQKQVLIATYRSYVGSTAGAG